MINNVARKQNFLSLCMCMFSSKKNYFVLFHKTSKVKEIVHVSSFFVCHLNLREEILYK